MQIYRTAETLVAMTRTGAANHQICPISSSPWPEAPLVSPHTPGSGFEYLPSTSRLVSKPRLLQRVSCTHIYSALDQTTCKINLAKFTHGKCSTLIMTNLAAWGLDILLLDNVINFSFPTKGKLFLHHVGRVAQAGPSSTVYSLAAPDEVPTCWTCTFLGSCPYPGSPHEEPSDVVSMDGMLGRVPQSMVDDEDCGLGSTLEASLELRAWVAWRTTPSSSMCARQSPSSGPRSLTLWAGPAPPLQFELRGGGAAAAEAGGQHQVVPLAGDHL